MWHIGKHREGNVHRTFLERRGGEATVVSATAASRRRSYYSGIAGLNTGKCFKIACTWERATWHILIVFTQEASRPFCLSLYKGAGDGWPWESVHKEEMEWGCVDWWMWPTQGVRNLLFFGKTCLFFRTRQVKWLAHSMLQWMAQEGKDGYVSPHLQWVSQPRCCKGLPVHVFPF